ncbi:MAG: 50S ribosomal protein L24 [Spirochaetaceae bacterium]|jgi:large subunit ribosomal protein L24|nr:50S ribosomal protein L24 [Spirochaetaceae bacterium]
MSVQAEAHKFRIKKDDTVEVIAGKEKGKRGRILRILRKKDRVVIDGLNLVKKTQKRRNQNDKGGIIEIEAALHASNVMIVCKKCGPTRIGYKFEGTVKKRICKKCGEAL